MKKEEYAKIVKKHDSPSPILKNCIKAFFVGGCICCFGQFLSFLFLKLDIKEEQTKTLVTITLIFMACLLTGIGIFDKIAKHAGAGTLVPITGFANAMCSPAIDNTAEGFILGVGAKMFTIAGPVIVYGVSASVVYGLIYWITTLF